MIAMDLSKQQAIVADPNAIKQINFTGNLSGNNNRLFFIIEEAKETISDFSKGPANILWMFSNDWATACSTILSCFNIISM